MSGDLLRPMKWDAWGDPDAAKPLPDGIRSLLKVTLDLRRFDQLLALDEISGEAEFAAGVTGPEAERLLSAQ